ncbi:MAG: tRNA lysidine(34) synthetase TilS [Oscillospiraceae bacterium]|nr:tRNA lysidine(34) synthetase TilS [Oscillospiraceae bacterium]
MKTRTIECKVTEWVRRQGLLIRGDRVLVALSGGADSVCLARVLLHLRKQLQMQVFAAHYNHRLRGEDAAQDETFVRQFCRTFDLPLTVGTGDVAAAAEQSGRGIEETARDMRYAFLEATAQEHGATQIATGHNADDNVETVLLHLIRGTGLRGLAGIPPRRGNIVRPILCLEREEIEAYLAELGQDFVEDHTNSDTSLRRNALRHQVLPLLREQNPNLAATVLRQSELLRQDGTYLDGMAEKFTNLKDLSVKDLTTLDPAIASRVVVLAVQSAGGEADAVHVRQVLDLAAGDDPSAETTVRGGVTVRREYDELIFGSRPVISSDAKKNQTFHFKKTGICGKITVRPRVSGDVIRLTGRGGTKTIKKLMIDEKIPAKQRDTWPIIADEAGVIAVYGIGTDERVTPGEGDEIVTIVVGEETDA